MHNTAKISQLQNPANTIGLIFARLAGKQMHAAATSGLSICLIAPIAHAARAISVRTVFTCKKNDRGIRQNDGKR